MNEVNIDKLAASLRQEGWLSGALEVMSIVERFLTKEQADDVWRKLDELGRTPRNGAVKQ